MSELLLEILSEEIPARMQGDAAEALKRLVTDGLKSAGIVGGEAEAFATPRRLALAIEGLPAKSAEVNEERKGPRVSAPEAAIAGFLKAAGLASIENAKVVKDAKKGDYYVAEIRKPGRATADIVAALIPEIFAKFPWPKSMRWGEGATRWVRPVQSILCLFDGKVVPFEIEGVKSGNATRGHPFLGSGEPILVKGLADYKKALKAEKVILEAPARSERILAEARERAAEAKLALVEDERLLAENAGLTEWPSVLVGAFDKEFLKVPPEVIITSIKTHQKCFALKEGKGGKLSNHFALVTNQKPKDGGAAIIKGNEKVIRARLSDARFFFEQDKGKKLEPMHFELKGITFHEKLGTQWDRMERITELARQIAGAVDAEPDLAGRAAQLCKADLVSGMVGEFPELQGLMGRYYAEAEHLNPKIAQAIEEHYKPKGPSDSVPKEPVSIAVALADKLDTLVGFWAIGEKPTGSGDPYQLRRAALGVIRIVLENDLRLPLLKEIERAFDLIWPKLNMQVRLVAVAKDITGEAPKLKSSVSIDLLAFFADRLKVHLKEKGARHDLIDAVFSLGGQDDLALIVKRVEALDAFLKTDDGANLLAGVKRAVNILKIEEKKDKASYEGQVSPDLLHEPSEKALYTAIQRCAWDGKKALEVENFKGAMAAVAEMRKPVDAFFEHVMVNVEEPALRKNRLALLSAIRAATMQVADFSKIAG